ncbi:MAG TPA: cupin domain-containing protein [Chloroflexota bacterium]
MAYAGQTITNPVTSEQITFLETTEDTQGDRLLFDCRVGPHGVPLPPHIHATQEEHLDVLDGTLGVMLGGKIYTLQPGQNIVLPARIKHQWWNAGRDHLSLRVAAVPARQLEAVLEAVAGMAHEGKLGRNGMPRDPFNLANLLRLSETFTPAMPIWVQRLALTVAASGGRLLRYDATFIQYRTPAGEVREQTETYEIMPAGTDRHDAA